MTSIGKTINNPKNFLKIYDETPVIYITEQENIILYQYVEENFQGEEYTEANGILNDILSYDSEYQLYNIDINKLADALDVYSYYQPIPEETLESVASKSELLNLINDYWDITDYPFGELIKKIIDLIKPRLGWIYELFSEGGALFVEGVSLAIDFINQIQNLNIAIIFASIINLIVSIPFLYFSESIRALFNLDFDGFINTITEFTGAFTTELSNLIDLIEALLEQLGAAFQPILDYVSDVGDFVDWLTAPQKPWEQEIIVSGTAITILGLPMDNADVTCRGLSSKTDSNGNFEFTVEPSDNADDSFPANSWFGLHNCVITISKNGEVLKQTPVKLSYVFSGGEIVWPFVIFKGKPKDFNIRENILEKLNALIEKIQNLFPNFLGILR
jgi:hypothetical protein